MDVVFEDSDMVYDIEMQCLNTAFLEKRARYYSIHLDMSQLKTEQDYERLKKTYVIFICKFDFFGLGQALYKFEMMDEEKQLKLNDGRYIMFVNTRAVENVSEELRNLFDYISYDVLNKRDAFLCRLEKEVAKINVEFEESGMYIHEQHELELKHARQEGLAEGLAEGKAENSRDIAKGLKEEGVSIEIIEKTTGLTKEEIEKL